jgi:hypothetical protein
MYGGVGGEDGQPSPLSRFFLSNRVSGGEDTRKTETVQGLPFSADGSCTLTFFVMNPE